MAESEPQIVRQLSGEDAAFVAEQFPLYFECLGSAEAPIRRYDDVTFSWIEAERYDRSCYAVAYVTINPEHHSAEDVAQKVSIFYIDRATGGISVHHNPSPPTGPLTEEIIFNEVVGLDIPTDEDMETMRKFIANLREERAMFAALERDVFGVAAEPALVPTSRPVTQTSNVADGVLRLPEQVPPVPSTLELGESLAEVAANITKELYKGAFVIGEIAVRGLNSWCNLFTRKQ